MDIETFRDYMLSLPKATEDTPFGEDVLVFRLEGKIFGCIALDKPDLCVLKCNPERAIELREQHSEIEGAYHWNKKRWNQIPFNQSVDDNTIRTLANHAYNEVAKKLPKKTRQQTPLLNE